MTTFIELFDGVNLIRPSGEFKWPHHLFEGFPDCCGSGLSEKVIPEKVLGLPVSPACYIHDWMWAHGPRTWQGFHFSNSVFLTNMLEINKRKGGYWVFQAMRQPLLLARFVAVSSPIGAARFFSLGDKK